MRASSRSWSSTSTRCSCTRRWCVALGANHAFTLVHYKAIFTDGWKAIRDTLIIAGFAMPLGGLYGILMGYLVARKAFVGRRTLELVSMINYALPGTIVGIAYLIAFNDPPLVLTGTALIIVACYVFRYGPTGIRATIALLSQIDKSLEEASQGLGARQRHDVPPRDAPAHPAGVLRGARHRVRPLDDRHQRHDLPRVHRVDAHHGQDPREHDRAVARAGRGVLGASSSPSCSSVIALIGRLLRWFRAPGVAPMTSLLGG